MRVLVDGVFFQLAQTGIARVWTSILPRLAARGDLDILLLDRGGTPDIPGLRRIAWPTWSDTWAAADSQLIQHICDAEGIDVFTSTYYTTPLRTPMALMVYDMIPEVLGFDLSAPMWREKALAIAYAQRFTCISHQTRADLLALHPDIPPDQARAAWCGIDRATFRPRAAAEIAAFRARHGLPRDYVVFVGTRGQGEGQAYKNSRLFFDALPHLVRADLDILCVGGEPELPTDRAPPGMRLLRVTLSDDDLAIAYGGAVALIYPSLYEGFGLPVAEAMASGCPVITSARGALAEVAGDAALLIGGTSVPEMAEALARIRAPALRDDLRTRGLARAALFDWQPLADAFATQLAEARDDGRNPARRSFFREWERLRRIAADLEG